MDPALKHSAATCKLGMPAHWQHMASCLHEKKEVKEVDKGGAAHLTELCGAIC